MPLVKRVFHIPCRGDECLELATIISEKTPIVEALDIDITNSGLMITMYGYKTDIKRAWENIKSIVKNYKVTTAFGKTTKKYSLQFLVETTRKTFPPQLLVEILNYMGYKALYNNEEIITDASLDLVIEVINKINIIAENIRYKLKGKTTKYYVIAAPIITGKSVEEIIHASMEKGLMAKNNDELIITKEWRKALKEILENMLSA